MLEKIKSRKLIVAAIGSILILINEQIGLDMSTATMASVGGVVAAYILGQSYVDSVGKKK